MDPVLDLDALLAPVSDDAPTGEDLEYDPEFGELTRAAEGKPEKQMGDHVIEAEEPDWRAVRSQAEALFARTKDYRVAVLLGNALVRQEGFAGLRDVLQLMRRMTDDYWETVHPQLDEDDGDPAIRCNAVQELGNRTAMLKGVLETPFVSSRVVGRFSLRDLKVIAGELSHRESDDRPKPERAHVDAAFQDIGPDEASAIAEVIGACVEAANGLAQTFTEKVGQIDAPDIGEFMDALQEIDTFVAEQLTRLGVGAADDAAGDAAGDGAAAAAGGGAAAGARAPISGDVTSRDDVVRLIGKICLYYEQAEPSSPVPILLRRAESLVHKGFMEILEDLTPSGVSEAQRFEKRDGGSADAAADSWSESAAPADESSAKKSDDW